LTDTEFIQNIDNTKTKETIQEQADYAKIMRGLLGQDLGDEVQTLWMGAKERSHRRAQAEAEDS
jgi:hypothetical protein